MREQRDAAQRLIAEIVRITATPGCEDLVLRHFQVERDGADLLEHIQSLVDGAGRPTADVGTKVLAEVCADRTAERDEATRKYEVARERIGILMANKDKLVDIQQSLTAEVASLGRELRAWGVDMGSPCDEDASDEVVLCDDPTVECTDVVTPMQCKGGTLDPSCRWCTADLGQPHDDGCPYQPELRPAVWGQPGAPGPRGSASPPAVWWWTLPRTRRRRLGTTDSPPGGMPLSGAWRPWGGPDRYSARIRSPTR